MKITSVRKLVLFALVLTMSFSLFASFGSTTVNAVSAPKKRVAIVVLDLKPLYIHNQINNVINGLKDKGYSKTNTDFKTIDLSGNIDNATKAISDIQAYKPDIIISCSSVNMVDKVMKPLADTKLPLVLDMDADNKVYTSNKNVTGLRTFPTDLQTKGYELLNKISPIKGKKAVFVTFPVIFNKTDTTKALSANKIALKEYLETNSFEKYKQFVLKYQKDPEVGWILIGAWPSNNIEKVKREDIIAWDIANLKKPQITFWESAVANCQMAGMAVDLEALGFQQADMAAQILKGTKPSDIPIQNPKKLCLVLNQQRAKDIGITFPVDIMSGAYKIYTDYTGKNFIGQK